MSSNITTHPNIGKYSDVWQGIRITSRFVEVSIRLQMFGFARTATWLDEQELVSGVENLVPTPLPPAVNRTIDFVDGIGKYIPVRSDCLRRAAVLRLELIRLGMTSEVCLGARNCEGELAIHAWLESGGIVIGESEEVAFAYVRLNAPRKAIG